MSCVESVLLYTIIMFDVLPWYGQLVLRERQTCMLFKIELWLLNDMRLLKPMYDSSLVHCNWWQRQSTGHSVQMNNRHNIPSAVWVDLLCHSDIFSQTPSLFSTCVIRGVRQNKQSDRHYRTTLLNGDIGKQPEIDYFNYFSHLRRPNHRCLLSVYTVYKYVLYMTKTLIFLVSQILNMCIKYLFYELLMHNAGY